MRDLARRILELDERINENDKEITSLFLTDDRAVIIEAMPEAGPSSVPDSWRWSGDKSARKDDGHLTAHAGLAPMPRDSGRKSGNLHRPKNYSRRLRYVFYMSALLRCKAVPSLTRRRAEVL